MTDNSTKTLLEKIAVLEEENRLLRKGITSFLTVGDTITVPKQFKEVFDKAQKMVGSYFQGLKADPSKARIDINGERYVLLRASSLSVGFLNKIRDLYADKGEKEAFLIGQNFLFDIAHVLGIEDAQNFHKKMNLTDPISKLSAGPIHFAYSGWAFVDILPESRPTPDENFFLKYNHPYSFEADSWILEGKKADFPVCIMNAGYSSGWCEQSFDLPLTAVEVTCRAKGDENCTFIMAPPHKIQEHLKEEDHLANEKREHEIPLFFERKKSEELIKASLEEKDVLLKEVHHRVKNNLQLVSSFLSLQSHFLPDSATRKMFEETRNRIKTLAMVHEKLYKSDSQFVVLKEYIESVVDLLAYSFHQEGRKIVIELNCDSIEKLNIDIAVPCGLIVNELVSNAFKHGFPKCNDGIITIDIVEDENGYILSVKDNGIGLPDGFDLDSFNSLGLEIVCSLVEQLDGQITFETKPDTIFTIVVNKSK